jgi:prevent-host-death family protein
MTTYRSRSKINEAGFFPFLTSKQLAKTEARQDFFQLLNSVESEPTVLKITDRGREVAVIMGIRQYQMMLDMLQKYIPEADKDPLAGLIADIGDLDRGAEKVKALFKESISKSAADLK